MTGDGTFEFSYGAAAHPPNMATPITIGSARRRQRSNAT
jgi:hypothetical protein